MDSMFSSEVSPLLPALYDVKLVTVSLTLAGTLYVLTYSADYDYLGHLNKSLGLGLDSSKIMNYSVSNCALTVVAGKDSSIISFKNDFTCTFLYNFGDYISPLSITDTKEEIVNATGGRVYINFPDFSGFTEVS